LGAPATAVVLLNWNGAEDTIECVNSLLQMRNQDFFIVLCDNKSADGSFETLRQWGESTFGLTFAIWTLGDEPARKARIILIQTGDNLGFAGGCNVGIRYALLHPSVQFLWLLNNDTVVDEDSLGLQIQRMEATPKVGILGSTLIFFHEPDQVQASGGYDFNFWTARVLIPFADLTLSSLPSEAAMEERLMYISGASMFVRRSFVEEIGLLNEQYFLYFEEVDWATRAKGRFALGYCAASRILHKEGSSIGSHRSVERRSGFSERYLSRNRVLFIRSYFPCRLVVCLSWILAVGVARLLTGRAGGALNLWKGSLDGLSAPIRPLPRIDEWPSSMRGVSSLARCVD
jgi:GT2 family glycosyltransferase